MEEMNNQVEGQIRTEDKKAFWKAALFWIGSMFVGGIVGFFSAFGVIYMIEQGISLPEVLEQLKPTAAYIASWVLLAFTVIMNLICAVRIAKHLKQMKKWDAKEELSIEEEEELEKIEKKINRDLLLVNLMVMGEFLLFGIAGNNLMLALQERAALYFVVLAFYLFSSFSQIVMQQKIVNQYKKRNPEKRGSVYDLQFNKKWFESCDEAERAAIGMAAKKAYSAVNVTCLVLEICLSIASMMLGIGILAHIMVIVIWAVSTIVYYRESVKLSKHFQI